MGTSHCSWVWLSSGRVGSRGWGAEGVGAGCGRAHLVQWDSGRSLQDTWNAAETEGRVLISPLGFRAKRAVPERPERKRLIPLMHNECVRAHWCPTYSMCLCVCVLWYVNSPGRSSEMLFLKVLFVRKSSNTDTLGWRPSRPTIPKHQDLTIWKWDSKIYFSYKYDLLSKSRKTRTWKKKNLMASLCLLSLLRCLGATPAPVMNGICCQMWISTFIFLRILWNF